MNGLFNEESTERRSMSDKAKDYKKLVKIVKHDGYFINPATLKITWRGTVNGVARTIRTGVVAKINAKTGAVEGITKAKELVETEIFKMKTGKSDVDLKRSRLGITNPFFKDVYAEMCDAKTPGKEPSTVANYHKAYTYGMRGFWDNKTVRHINSENLALYKQWYLSENAERLFDKTFDFLKMVLKFMVERKYLKEMPDVSILNDLDEIIKKNTKYEKAGRVFTAQEQAQLLVAWHSFTTGSVSGTTSHHKKLLGARARLAILLGLRCGLRAMEVFKAEVANFDLKRGVARVWSFKNHKWREVPLVPEVVEAVKYQIAMNAPYKSTWLFPRPSEPSKHIPHQVLEKVWYRSREYAGIVVKGPLDARFHDLRKTFTTMTAELGWPWKTACEILDMSGDMYEKTYANKIALASKVDLMNRSFGKPGKEIK